MVQIVVRLEGAVWWLNESKLNWEQCLIYNFILPEQKLFLTYDYSILGMVLGAESNSETDDNLFYD